MAALVPRRLAADKDRVRRLSDSLASLLSLALPPRCPGCATPVDRDHQFCAACWQGLHFLRPPWCARCNRPFDYDRGAGVWCATCLAAPPRLDGIRAAVAYGPVARRLALKLKYGGRIGVADTMAALIAPAMTDNADLLVPVPLHRWRLWSRGFNQAALIARALSGHTGVPVEIGVLVRSRRTAVLRGLDRRRRRRAVAGAFAVVEARLIKGRTIVLIDDVYASGATADACARALLKAGAASVSLACWARVVGDGPGAR